MGTSGRFTIVVGDHHSHDGAADQHLWLWYTGFGLLGAALIVGAVLAYPRQQTNAVTKANDFNGYEELLNEHPSITTAFDAMSTTRADWLVDLKSLDMKEMVGIGASAQVFRAIFCGHVVAVKRMPVLLTKRKGEVPCWWRESREVVCCGALGRA